MDVAVDAMERLQTFYTSPLPEDNENNRPFSNSATKFADAGFVRTPSSVSDEVECILCGAKYRDWAGESPAAVHRILNPNCPFLNPLFTSRSPPSGNGFGNSNNTLVNIRRQLFPETDRKSSDILNVSNFEHPFLPQGGYLMLFESHRLMTFGNPVAPDAAVFAKGGFMYSLDSGSPVCVYCSIQIDYKPIDRSYLDTLHEQMSPLCPFVRLFDVGNISREDERKINEKSYSQCKNDIFKHSTKAVTYAIMHPEFEDFSARLGTFASWPKCLSMAFPKEAMANCGFYYTGFSDKVKCYACGVGLYDWSPEAVQEEQHAKASPTCIFLLQSKGKEFVDRAQNIQLIIEADYENISQSSDHNAVIPCVSSSSSTDSLNAATPASSSSMSSSALLGSPVLDLGAIKAAMACQYTLEQIYQAVHKFFIKSCGKYPNKDLLLGALKAADENNVKICEKTHKIVQMQAKEAVYQQEIQATKTELQATKCELQRKAVELQWHELEVRTELEQQFVGIIQQKDQEIEQNREEIERNREVIEQHIERIEQNAIQLEMKSREVADLQRHIRSLMAELTKRQIPPGSDDEEFSSSDLEHGSETKPNCDEFSVTSCKVCLVKQSQIVFHPCKHLCCCDGCASRLHGKSCPICREQTSHMEKVYVI